MSNETYYCDTCNYAFSTRAGLTRHHNHDNHKQAVEDAETGGKVPDPVPDPAERAKSKQQRYLQGCRLIERE